jgi:serine/threonine protein kinase
MSDTERETLPVGFAFRGYEIRGAPADDGFALYYPAARSGDRLPVTIAEFLPLGIARRTGQYVEPEYGREDLFDEARERFSREAKALAGIAHDNVLATLDLIRYEGTSYRVQARREGSTLAGVIGADAALSQRELYQILDPLLDGLEAMHAAGVAHHAVSPEAVLFLPSGVLLWTDMSGARLACARACLAEGGAAGAGKADVGALALSPDPYRAPELARAGRDEAGPRADIYGLAAVFYRLIAGRPPQTAAERAAGEQTLPAVDHAAGRYNEQFLSAVDVGLALDPAERPHSIADWRPMFRRARRKVL